MGLIQRLNPAVRWPRPGGVGPYPVPATNAFFNSTEFPMDGGVPVDPNILWMEDFSRGWGAKYNVIGYPGPQNAGTRASWTVANQVGAIADTGGNGYNYFAQNAIPVGGVPGLGQTGNPNVALNTQPGRGGAVYGASFGNQPTEGGDWFFEHELYRNVTSLIIRHDFYFYPGYQFGQEKVCTFRQGGTFGDGGIQWGGLYWNPGAGSASSTGSVQYSHSTLGGGTNFNSGFSVTGGNWYSITVGIVLGTGSGDGAIRIWADNLGADGNTVPTGRIPTLRGEWTGLSIPSIGGTARNIGNVWDEAWSNPGSVGTQIRTNIVALEGVSAPLIRAA